VSVRYGGAAAAVTKRGPISLGQVAGDVEAHGRGGQQCVHQNVEARRHRAREHA